MEEKVRLFNEKTKGFMEASRKGHFVSARNVTLSKFSEYLFLVDGAAGEVPAMTRRNQGAKDSG